MGTLSAEALDVFFPRELSPDDRKALDIVTQWEAITSGKPKKLIGKLTAIVSGRK